MSAAAAARRASAAVAIAALLSTSLFTATSSGAQDDARQRDLSRIRSDIVRLRGQLDDLDRRKLDLSGELQRTRLELELQETRVVEAMAARDLARASATETAARIGELEVEIDRLRTGLKEGLAWLYRLGFQGYLRLMLSIQSRQHLLPAIRSLRFFARRNAAEFNDYLDTRARLKLEQEGLERRRQEVEGWAAREQERRRRLAELQQEQNTLLARIERQRRSVEGDARELAEKERKLSNFIDFLIGRTGSPVSGRPIQEFKGVLDWPVEGRVLKAFGPQRDRRYGTEVPHNGLDIATRAAVPVRSMYAGKVLFAAPFQGFGLTAIVHHPGRVFTLYAGLSELSVTQNDMVPLGAVLGASSERLYLEIREENRPQDPMSWLR